MANNQDNNNNQKQKLQNIFDVDDSKTDVITDTEVEELSPFTISIPILESYRRAVTPSGNAAQFYSDFRDYLNEEYGLTRFKDLAYCDATVGMCGNLKPFYQNKHQCFINDSNPQTIQHVSQNLPDNHGIKISVKDAAEWDPNINPKTRIMFYDPPWFGYSKTWKICDYRIGKLNIYQVLSYWKWKDNAFTVFKMPLNQKIDITTLSKNFYVKYFSYDQSSIKYAVFIHASWAKSKKQYIKIKDKIRFKKCNKTKFEIHQAQQKMGNLAFVQFLYAELQKPDYKATRCTTLSSGPVYPILQNSWPRSGKHHFSLDTLLNAKQLSIFKQLIGNKYLFSDPIKPSKDSQHSMLRGLRRFSRTLLYNSCGGLERLSIGDSGSEHRHFGHILHCLRPIISVSDLSRSKKICKRVTACNHTFKQFIDYDMNNNVLCACQGSEVGLSIHSLYYLSMEDIADCLHKGKLRKIYANVHYFKGAGGTLLNEAEWCRIDEHGIKIEDQTGGLISMRCNGDRKIYRHKDVNWLFDGVNGANVCDTPKGKFGWTTEREYAYIENGKRILISGDFKLFPIQDGVQPDYIGPLFKTPVLQPVLASTNKFVTKYHITQDELKRLNKIIREVGLSRSIQRKLSIIVTELVTREFTEKSNIRITQLTAYVMSEIISLRENLAHDYLTIESKNGESFMAVTNIHNKMMGFDQSFYSEKNVQDVENYYIGEVKYKMLKWWRFLYTSKRDRFKTRHPIKYYITCFAGSLIAGYFAYRSISYVTDRCKTILSNYLNAKSNNMIDIKNELVGGIKQEYDNITNSVIKTTTDIYNDPRYSHRIDKAIDKAVDYTTQDTPQIFNDERSFYEKVMDWYKGTTPRNKYEYIKRIHESGELKERFILKAESTIADTVDVLEDEYERAVFVNAGMLGVFRFAKQFIMEKCFSVTPEFIFKRFWWTSLFGLYSYYKSGPMNTLQFTKSAFTHKHVTHIKPIQVLKLSKTSVSSYLFKLLGVAVAYCVYTYLTRRSNPKYLYKRYDPDKNIIYGTCTGIRTHDYIRPGVKIKIGEDTLRMYNLNDCPPKPMIYYYGPIVNRTGKAMKKCEHNAINSAYSRIFLDVYKCPKYKSHYTHSTMLQLYKWLDDYWDVLWRPVGQISQTSYEDWIKKYTSRKLVETLKASNQLIEERLKTVFISDHHLHDLIEDIDFHHFDKWLYKCQKPLKPNIKWWNKYGGREVFLKYEYLLIHPDKDKQARIVMAPTPRVKCVSGRYCDAVTDQVKRKFCPKDDSFMSNDFYCSGKNKYEIGNTIENYIEECLRYDSHIISASMDHDRYDLHHSVVIFLLQWIYFNKMVYPTNFIKQWQLNEMHMNGKFMGTRHGIDIEFSNMLCRGSGGAETTTGNTWVGVVCSRFAWYQVLDRHGLLGVKPEVKMKNFKDIPIYTAYLGDDNATITVSRYAKYIPEFKEIMAQLGWSLKIDIGDICDLEFCSSYFVPADVWDVDKHMWVSTRVLLNKPGRVISKFGHSIKPRGSYVKQLAYLKAILQGFREQDCLIFMKAYRFRLLEIIDLEIVRLQISQIAWDTHCKYQKTKWEKESRAKYRATGYGKHKTRSNQHTNQWIMDKYDITSTQISELALYMSNIPHLHVVLDHPVLDVLLNTDTFEVE